MAYAALIRGNHKVRQFWSIKGRLILFSLCISLIPIAVITTIYYLNARNTLKKQTMERLEAVAESKKTHILQFMENKKGRAVDFSSDGFIRDSLEEINRGESPKQDNVSALNRHLSVNKRPLDTYIEGIEVVNLKGKVVASTHEAMIGNDVSSHNQYIRIVTEGYSEPYVGQPHYSPYLDAMCICVSAPLTSRRGVEQLGIIINHYDMALLSEITTDRAGLGETGEAYLVNSDGMMLTESRFIDGAPLKQVVDTEPVHKIADGGEKMTGIYL
ncbi:MAG: cache domain-containing protein, partial [Candidatus Brocadiales bacterium]